MLASCSCFFACGAGDLRATVNGFAQVLVAPAGDGVVAATPMPAIEIEWVGNTRVRIPASVSPAFRGRCR